MSLDSWRVLVELSILPEQNFLKTRFQGFGLFLDQPKAEPFAETGAPLDSTSDSVALPASAPASCADLSVVAYAGFIEIAGLWLVGSFLCFKLRTSSFNSSGLPCSRRGYVVVTRFSNASYTANWRISHIQTGWKGIQEKISTNLGKFAPPWGFFNTRPPDSY